MKKHLLIILLFLSTGVFGQASHAVVGSGSNQKDVEIVVPFGYSVDAQAAIDNMATVPPVATQDNMAICVDCLVAAAAWAEMDYFLGMSMDTEANSLSDWINGVDATKIGATPPTFITFVDWLSGTGSDDGAIDTNFDPGTDCVNCAQDDASYSAYITDNGVTTNGLEVFGSKDASHQLRVQQDGSDDDWAASCNNAQGNGLDNFTTGIADNSYVTVARSQASQYNQIRDGSVDQSPGRTSSGLSTEDIYLHASNLNTVIEGENSQMKMAAFVVGSSSINHSAVKICLEGFITNQAP